MQPSRSVQFPVVLGFRSLSWFELTCLQCPRSPRQRRLYHSIVPNFIKLLIVLVYSIVLIDRPFHQLKSRFRKPNVAESPGPLDWDLPLVSRLLFSNESFTYGSSKVELVEIKWRRSRSMKAYAIMMARWTSVAVFTTTMNLIPIRISSGVVRTEAK